MTVYSTIYVMHPHINSSGNTFVRQALQLSSYSQPLIQIRLLLCVCVCLGAMVSLNFSFYPLNSKQNDNGSFDIIVFQCVCLFVVVDAVGGFGNDDVGGVGSCIYRYIFVLHRFFISFVIIPSYQNFYVYLLFV